MKKTSLIQNVQNADRPWFIVDAAGKRLGTLAVDIANALRGKNLPSYTPHSDMGAYVIVINADKIEVSGHKEERKNYFRHSGYLGHLKVETLKTVRAKQPERILESAVSGMLPKNRLRKDQMRRLFLTIGEEHQYAAQKPQPLTLSK